MSATITARVLELLAVAPDQDSVTIALRNEDLPPNFVLPVWVATGSVETGRAISEALADRPRVVDVILTFPGHAMPLHFAIPPRN